MSTFSFHYLYNSAKEMEHIAELGSYLGRSTVALAEGCKGTVYAIDHWDWKDGFGLVMNGTEFDQFVENVKEFNNIHVYKGYTEDVAPYFGEIDMVFIDADHRYESVKRDINDWLPKAKKLICGHDYDNDDTKKAVDELIDIDGVIGSIWYRWV